MFQYIRTLKTTFVVFCCIYLLIPTHSVFATSDFFSDAEIEYYDPKACDPNSPSPTQSSDGSNAKTVFDILTENEISAAGAAGIVGNLMQESGGGTEDIDPEADNGTHRGIAQWDKTDRYINLQKFARDSSGEPDDLTIQAKFILEELKDYEDLYSFLKSTNNYELAAGRFVTEFERSGERPGSAGYDNRLENAKTIYEKYQASAASSTTQINSCVCSSSSSDPTTPMGEVDGTLESFIDTYGQAAFDVGKKYSIPYEAIIAQAAIESGYGQSRLTKEANNFFGIKAGSQWKGKVIEMNTEEEGPRGRYTVKAQFRSYSSPEAGFTGYAKFIHNNPRYAQALNHPKDPEQYIKEIKKAGYATDSQYVDTNLQVQQKIKEYIRSKNLFPPSSDVDPAGLDPGDENSDETFATTENCSGGTGSGNQGVVDIAKREYQENKDEVEYEGDILEYTSGREEAWCADFVSWVYKEAGKPFTSGNGGGGNWQYPAVVDLQAYMKNEQIFFKPGEQTPKPGDIAFYIGALTPDGGSTEHVNIVIDVSGNKMTTIGGNESNKIMKSEREIRTGAQSLAGFGRMK